MRVEAFCMPGTWQTVQDYARYAEAAGFDSFASPEITGDPFLMAAMAAAATERIKIRTAIAVAFPRSPMVTANLAWDIHANSGGRFALGLGTQVKGHNERRFSVPWSKPATRLREYVESLRAIWNTWQNGVPLEYRGEFYTFSLMTPEFSPPATHHDPIPVYTAAVRPAMIRLSARVADGVRLHGFSTRRYLEEISTPAIAEQLADQGRDRSTFEVCGGGFVLTGKDDEAVAAAREWVRYRIGFYGSTRSYLPVMELHGWEELAAELHHLSKTGGWADMPAAIPDEVVDEFVAIGRYDQIAAAVEKRLGGLSDCIEMGFAPDAPAEEVREVLADVQRIPARFTGHALSWD